MKFSSTITTESKSCPGVRFVTKRIGFSRGIEIDFACLPHRQRLREIEADYPAPEGREKELAEQLDIAQRKALAVPADQFETVLQADVIPLAAELKAAAPPEARKRRAVLDEEYKVIDARIRSEWIKAGLLKIEGGDVDGMTPAELLDFGPPALAQEIYQSLIEDGRLAGKDAKNLPSPTTSGPVVGTESPSTNAASAVDPPADGTPAATASSTSPAR